MSISSAVSTHSHEDFTVRFIIWQTLNDATFAISRDVDFQIFPFLLS